MNSAQALTEAKEEILSQWERRVRSEIKAATDIQHPLLIDTVPAFLTNLAEALSEEHPRKLATDSTSISQEHGGERARLTQYSPDQLILEYQILRDAIFEHLKAAGELSSRDHIIVQKSIDQGLCESMMAFFLVHSQLREQFVSGLSHDLRNPLGAAKMSAELILNILKDGDGEDMREDIRRLAQKVVNNAKRADRMIQDLLDASLIQVGERIPLKIVECDMLAIISDVVGNLQRKDQARVHISGAPTYGFWDYDGLRRAIENLISNALKYGDADRPISVRVSSSHARAMVCVHNEGKPIPPEELELLFQPFRRSHSAKQSGKVGWGIGLALVRGVAEAHGGSISVDSAPEFGTTFTLDIPQDSRDLQNAPVTG